MIKINLLTSYKQTFQNIEGNESLLGADQDDSGKSPLVHVAKNTLILFIGPLSLYLYEVQAISSLQTNLNEKNASNTELKNFNDSKSGLAEQIKKYMVQQAHFVAQADFINKIDRDKINEFTLFQHLKNLTPQSVWIERLELNNNSLVIRAESDVGTEIDSFIQRLSNSDVITNLTILNRSSKTGYAGTDIETTVVNINAQLTDNSKSSKESK